MLVLSRRPGESLFLGDDIKIHILKVIGKQVRIGLEAPGTVNIRRSELIEKPKRNKNARPLLTL